MKMVFQVLFSCIALLLISITNVNCNESDGYMTITISYSPLNETANTFFRSQLTAVVLKQLSDCSTVRWEFLPCASSYLEHGQLKCEKDEDECSLERRHTCAKSILEQNAYENFVICMMSKRDQLNQGLLCVNNDQTIWQSIENCVFTENPDEKCNDYYELTVNRRKIKRVPGILFDKTYREVLNIFGVKNFLETACFELKSRQLSCTICNQFN